MELGRHGTTVRFQRAPYLAATRDDGPLVAGQLELSLSELTVFSVSGGTLTGGASGSVTGSNLTDLGVSPCGERQLFTAAGSREEVGAYATTDLAGRGVYRTSAFPNSTAASPRGCFIAAGRRTGEGKGVHVYRIGGAAPVRSFALGAGVVLAPRGLAWCATEKLLFAVVLSARGGASSLRALANPAGDGGR